jgi:two-component sensor histidine kinase
LDAALAREETLRRENDELLQHRGLLAQEFEHRLSNGLQMIASLLTLQSRTTTPDAAKQLAIAARRVVALGRVHQRLHLLDHQERVEFKGYLQHLCGDLSGLLFQEGHGHAIVVEGTEVAISTMVAIPLGFIVNELVTNSAKYTQGDITVRFETTSPACHSLSVLDNGPGLPTGFDPARSKGLGMKIVLALVKQIGGTLHVLSGDTGYGACMTIRFGSPQD